MANSELMKLKVWVNTHKKICQSVTGKIHFSKNFSIVQHGSVNA